jgi:hypothetical protein
MQKLVLVILNCFSFMKNCFFSYAVLDYNIFNNVEDDFFDLTIPDFIRL